MYFNSKNGNTRSFSYEKKSINIFNPNEGNVFMTPNHEKKGDCYMKIGLSQLKGKLQF